MLKPHSDDWYDRLATMQQGYYYPWRSRLPANNGEDTFLDVVTAHLSPEVDLLEIACGHGAMALDLAPSCRSIVGYDRVQAFIDLAQELARTGEVDNARFLFADSSAQANGGKPRIPAADDSFDSCKISGVESVQ
ncbi:MAG: class I SAM-dependent methyltransferase [Chloroflexi bacterium]|nr:class I SAM-dependent methyltransferase [Chloroflexota bacterium]